MRNLVQDDGTLTIGLGDRIDTNNAGAIEAELNALVEQHAADRVELDAEDLEYISSTGLRVVTKLLKKCASLSLINASPSVYDVFDMTGLNQMMDVRRRPREVSIDGLQQIGAGANGRVFRLDEERIIKVYNPVSNPPEKILREREASRKAFVRGIPSTISFELVRVGEAYGIIYEMVDAHTLGETIAAHPERLEEYATRMARLLKQLHGTEFEEGDLPDARQSLYIWVDIAERSGLYADETIAKLRAVIDAIPPRNTFVHGDFHPGNIMVTDDDELLLIDMGDASMGDPIVDMLAAFQIMFTMRRLPGATKLYTGLDEEEIGKVWDVFAREYYGTDDAAEMAAIEQRLRLHSFIRSMPGISFSEAVSEEGRKALADQANAQFLLDYEAVFSKD